MGAATPGPWGASGFQTSQEKADDFWRNVWQQRMKPKPPPRAPDLTDEAVQAAARQARQQVGRNRASTFLSTPGSGSKSTILGGGK